MRGRRERWLTAATCSVLLKLCGASAAHAAEVSLEAPPSCAIARELTEEVERLVGRPLSEVPRMDFAIRVTQHAASKWQVALRTTSAEAPSGPALREINGQSCAEVRDAAAVAMALAIEQRQRSDADADLTSLPRQRVDVAAESPSAAAPARSSAGTAAPVRRAISASPNDRAQSGPWIGIDVGLGGVVDAGALPGMALGAELELSARLASLRVVAVGALFTSQITRVADGGGGEFRFVLGGALVCGERPARGLRALGCAGFELGQISAEGFGVSNPRSGTAPWRAIRLDAGLALPIGQDFALMARAGAAIPLTRPDFVFSDTQRVHRPDSLSVRASLMAAMSL